VPAQAGSSSRGVLFKKMTNLSAQFKAYLIANHLSAVSVKNYVSDINKFLATIPDDKTPQSEDFKNYYDKINQNNTPSQTLKRYQSALRKFGQFLKEEYALAKNPAVILETRKTLDTSAKQINPEKMLDAYRKSLEKSGSKPATIKNYLADTRQFLDWLGTI